MLTAVLFIIGLFFGSFFLVIIDRLPRSISPWSGRSKCDACGHALHGRDLIPVLSYALQRGKCRYCHVRLSGYYPFLEVTTGIFFAITPLLLRLPSLSTMTTGSWIELAYTLLIISTFIIVFFIDLKQGIIPFIIVIPATIIALLYNLALTPTAILPFVASAVGAGLFFFLIFFFTKGRGMGFGDVVLAVYLGMVLGFPAIVSALYIAFLTGAGISLILILLKKKKMKGSTIPFGPFLILGAYISFFWGEQLFSLISGYLLR